MRKVLAITICALVFAAGAYAQATAGLGAVSGTVRDASGAVIPGATVVVANDGKGIKRTMTSTDAGVFAAPALTPSSGYSITVTKQGFATYEVKDFEILVGQNVDFRIGLQVGSANIKVDVTAEAPLVEETKSGVTATVGKDQIDNLPINGRRVDSFVLLTPAVTNDGEFGLLSFRGIAAGNAFLTDGNDTTNSFYNENAGRTRIGSQISQDAVQEFQVLSNGFSAEFGRAMGGVVNTVTRSGQNDIHGTGYWFFRNRTLEAADRYANGYKTPEWRHNVGVSLGGPIKKDKIFYFFNLDYTDRNFPALNRIVNTSLTDGTGNFIPAANCVPNATAGPTPAQCAAAIAFIQKQMNVTVTRTYNQELGFGKIDWRPTDRNSFSFDMNYMRWVSPHGIQTQGVLTNGNALANNGNSTVQDKYGKASWTSVVTNSAVNELRFGWFKDRLSDPGASDLWPAETGPLYFTVAGTTLGPAQPYPRTDSRAKRHNPGSEAPLDNRLPHRKIRHGLPDHAGLDESALQRVRRLQLQQPSQLREGFLGQHARPEELHQLLSAVRQSDQDHAYHRHELLRAGYLEGLQEDHLRLRGALREELATATDRYQSGLAADGKHPPEQQELRTACQPVLFAGRPHRDPRGLRPVLCAHPRQPAGHAVPRKRQISDRHLPHPGAGGSARVPQHPPAQHRLHQTPRRVHPVEFCRSEELPRSLLATGNAGHRAPVCTRCRDHCQLHLEPRHRAVHAARSEPRHSRRPLHLQSPGCRRQLSESIHDSDLRARQPPGSALFQDPPDRKRRPVVVQRPRHPGAKTHVAWPQRPVELHLVTRYRRRQPAGRKQ